MHSRLYVLIKIKYLELSLCPDSNLESNSGIFEDYHYYDDFIKLTFFEVNQPSTIIFILSKPQFPV